MYMYFYTERCKCSATGDPHYKTFDGQMIHYQGVCTYTLVDARGQDCGLRVNVKNKRSSRNSKVALANKVTVTVWADPSFDEMTADEIVIDQGMKVTVSRVSCLVLLSMLLHVLYFIEYLPKQFQKSRSVL